MKIEDLHGPDTDSQIGVVFERVSFETKIDMVPQINPLIESVDRGRGEEVSSTSELACEKTQSQLSRAVKNHEEVTEVQAMADSNVTSGLPDLQVQESSTMAETGEAMPLTSTLVQEPSNFTLLDEIDKADERKCEKGISAKKKTLSRMLKGIRGEKVEDGAEKQANGAFSRMIQKVNPVGKVNRENVTKVLHRIGEVLHRKVDEGCELSSDMNKLKTLECDTEEKESQVNKPSQASSKLAKFGIKVFKSRTTLSEF